MMPIYHADGCDIIIMIRILVVNTTCAKKAFVSTRNQDEVEVVDDAISVDCK